MTLPADISPEMAAYISAVRHELLDLDADELDDVLDDLASHLRGIRADTGAPLVEMLGQPVAYAAELRASAGLGPVPPPPPAPAQAAAWAGAGAGPGVLPVGPGVADQLRTLLSGLGVDRWWREVRSFLPELRPAWWVARGYLVTVLLSAIISGSDGRGLGSVLIPPIGHSHLIGLVVLVLAVRYSVRWGRWASDTNRRFRILMLAATGAAVLGLLVFFASFPAPSSYDGAYTTTVPAFVEGVAAADGVSLADEEFSGQPANVYAYAPDGTPLGPVLLFDESGRPVVVVGGGLIDGGQVNRSGQTYSSGLQADVEVVMPADADGLPVGNLYPRELYLLSYDVDGRLVRERIPPPDVIGRIQASAASAASAPATTATAAPTTTTSIVGGPTVDPTATTALTPASGPSASVDPGAGIAGTAVSVPVASSPVPQPTTPSSGPLIGPGPAEPTG